MRELLPVVGANDETMVRGQGQENHFAFLCNYGKCLAEKRVGTGDADLFEGLKLQMEMWNAGVPSHRIYTGLGPIQATSHGGATPTVSLRIYGSQRKEVAGTAFSAADLDPVHRRYQYCECFNTANEASNPLHLCMRVTVLDR